MLVFAVSGFFDRALEKTKRVYFVFQQHSAPGGPHRPLRSPRRRRLGVHISVDRTRCAAPPSKSTPQIPGAESSPELCLQEASCISDFESPEPPRLTSPRLAALSQLRPEAPTIQTTSIRFESHHHSHCHRRPARVLLNTLPRSGPRRSLVSSDPSLQGRPATRQLSDGDDSGHTVIVQPPPNSSLISSPLATPRTPRVSPAN